MAEAKTDFVIGENEIAEIGAANGVPPGDLDALFRRPGFRGGFQNDDAWPLLSAWLLIAAQSAAEGPESIVDIDRAMRFGRGHALGPFEMWDAMWFEATARRMESEGRELPRAIHDMLWAQAKSFYRANDSAGEPGTEYFDLQAKQYKTINRPGVIILADYKRARGVVDSNASASLIDLGDGVICCEFHSKMNTVNPDVLRMLRAGLGTLGNKFQAMVVANQGSAFSAGADLKMILATSENQQWDELDGFLNEFQQVNLAMKYAPKPVVAAPFGIAFGGGCEMVLHSARVQASPALTIGLVEAGLGIVPAGGGCKEMVLRVGTQKAMDVIGWGKKATSAAEARGLGYLRESDRVSRDPEKLIGDAKQLALSLVADYEPGSPRADIPVGGESELAATRMSIWSLRESGRISEHDALTGEKLGYVLAGGRLTGAPKVSEQYLLDLEREAALSLCGTAKTQARIQHMLKTGQSLRN